MIYLILGFALLILLFGAVVLHNSYLKAVYAKIVDLKHEPVNYTDFYEKITVSQGSNFVGLANAAWIMLLIAISYFFLLTPGKLSFSYMNNMADWASSQVGLLALGVIATLFAIIVMLILDMLPENRRNLKLTELYSFYSISKNMKNVIILAIPFSGLSILLSTYIGIIYPEQNMMVEAISAAILFVSAVFLVLPVLVGRK
jgi:hypothetical protein